MSIHVAITRRAVCGANFFDRLGPQLTEVVREYRERAAGLQNAAPVREIVGARSERVERHRDLVDRRVELRAGRALRGYLLHVRACGIAKRVGRRARLRERRTGRRKRHEQRGKTRMLEHGATFCKTQWR